MQNHYNKIALLVMDNQNGNVSVRPEPNEPIVKKYRFRAFVGSNLEVLLRYRQIDTLILSGIVTSDVIL